MRLTKEQREKRLGKEFVAWVRRVLRQPPAAPGAARASCRPAEEGSEAEAGPESEETMIYCQQGLESTRNQCLSSVWRGFLRFQRCLRQSRRSVGSRASVCSGGPFAITPKTK